MKFLLLITFFLLVGCENLRHITNVNFSELKNIEHNKDYCRKLEEKVKVITAEESQSCTLIKEVKGRDTAVSPGKKVAIIYLRENTDRLDGNAVVIDEIIKRGNYYHEAYGRAFKCN